MSLKSTSLRSSPRPGIAHAQVAGIALVAKREQATSLAYRQRWDRSPAGGRQQPPMVRLHIANHQLCAGVADVATARQLVRFGRFNMMRTLSLR